MFSTRREFLHHAAGAAAAVCLAPEVLALAAEDEPRKPGSAMRIGLVTYLWGKDWDLPTLIKNCEKSEVLGVELRTTHAHGVEPSLSKEKRREVKKRFDDSPVVHLGPGSNERFDSPDPQALRAAIEATKAFVELSHDTGGSGVKVKPDRFHEEVPREKTIEQIGRSLNEVGKFAAEHGQEIRLEVHGQCAELPTMKAILDVADHPSVRVCWNSNAQDLQGKGLEHNFDLVKAHFGKTAHVRELDEGSYPYDKLFELLVGMDYDGWICLECRGAPEDPVAAMIAQRRAFEDLVANATPASRSRTGASPLRRAGRARGTDRA